MLDKQNIIVESLQYCQAKKGLEIFAWCLMTNHIHLIIRAKEGYNLSDILRDFKKFTASKILEKINDKTKVIAISWVQFLTGAQTDIEKLSKVTKEKNDTRALISKIRARSFCVGKRGNTGPKGIKGISGIPANKEKYIFQVNISNAEKVLK